MGFEDWPFIGTRGKRLRRLLAQAAEPALEQIRRDHARRQPIYPMPDAFEFLEAHLFSPELSVERLFEVTRVKASKAFQSFQAITGRTPKTYIEERRLETAVGLLLFDKNLPLDMLAAAIGYKTTGGFRRAFHRWARQLPSDFRRNILKHRARGSRLPEPAWFTSGWIAAFREGTLEPAERQAAMEWLRAGCGARPGGGAALARAEIERFERSWGRDWWQILRRLPAEQQRALVAVAPFESPVFFEHLCEQSREEGRDDRQRGVVVAELALEALGPLAKHTPEPALTHLQGKGWTVLATARWLALDHQGAEVAFATAEKHLATGMPPAELRAELLVSRSCLRYMQRRLAEALELADGALGLLEAPRGRLAAQILMARAQVYAVQGQAERALSDFLAAVAVLDDTAEPYLIMTVRQNLASALWRLGRLEEAEECLLHARSLAARLGKVTPWYHTLWLEGLIAEQKGCRELAVTRLREVCVGLRGLGSWGDFGVAALDLSRVEAQRGERSEAIAWAAQALPHLQALELENEGLAALALLRQQLATKQLSAAVLEQLRRSVGRAVGAPELQGGSQP